jgi:hypothetical protein
MPKIPRNINETNEVKKTGCWMKFKSLFEDRGFDLEYEYNNHRPATVFENNDEESQKKTRDKKREAIKATTNTDLDDELSGVINFYEQFATLNDEHKDDELWKRSGAAKHRVSMRPSMFLTNIIEETSSLADSDTVELEIVSNCKIHVKF